MGFLQRLVVIWSKVSLVQRALLIAIGLTFAAVCVFLGRWASRPDMRMLYNELNPKEASKITEKIAEKSIAYELRNGGTSIYVPKEDVYQLRLDMAKEGLPEGGLSGYRIFDKEKIGASPFVQNINLKRALQEELAKSIQMIDGVMHARIHIVNTEQKLFTSDGEQTSASVVIRLKPGYSLSDLNVAAITHLVAGSVGGLEPKDVTVIDSQGHLLSGESDPALARGAGTVADYKERVEQNLASKVENMLTSVLGPGRAAVRVSAVVDMTSTNLVTESYDPGQKVPTKEEIKSNSETKNAAVSGEGKASGPGGVKKDETIVTEYKVGKTVEQRVELPGEITSLSVAAFVDLSAADANSSQGNEGQETAMIMSLSDVEAIIKNALGLKETDLLKVVNTKFHRPAEVPVEEEEKGLDYIGLAGQASLGIMAICAVLVLKIFSGAKKKAGVLAGAEQLAASESAVGLLPGSTGGGSEQLMLRRQLTSTLENNPEQARQLFTKWLEEKA